MCVCVRVCACMRVCVCIHIPIPIPIHIHESSYSLMLGSSRLRENTPAGEATPDLGRTRGKPPPTTNSKQQQPCEAVKVKVKVNPWSLCQMDRIPSHPIPDPLFFSVVPCNPRLRPLLYQTCCSIHSIHSIHITHYTIHYTLHPVPYVLLYTSCTHTHLPTNPDELQHRPPTPPPSTGSKLLEYSDSWRRNCCISALSQERKKAWKRVTDSPANYRRRAIPVHLNGGHPANARSLGSFRPP